MYLKRQKVPKSWPIGRKGTTYVIRPSHNLEHGIPLLIIMRDILKLAQNRKEIKKSLNLGNILLNGKPVNKEGTGVSLFDVITIVPSKKHYLLTLTEKGKFTAKEIKEGETKKKVVKILDKKILKRGKVQLNLSDGTNILSQIDCKVGDSILIKFGGKDEKSKEAEKCVPLIKNSKILIIGGKHAGKKGVIKSIKPKRKMVESSLGEDNNTMVLIKHLIVLE